MLAAALRGSAFGSGVKELGADLFDSCGLGEDAGPWALEGGPRPAMAPMPWKAHLAEDGDLQGLQKQRASTMSMASTDFGSSFQTSSFGAVSFNSFGAGEVGFMGLDFEAQPQAAAPPQQPLFSDMDLNIASGVGRRAAHLSGAMKMRPPQRAPAAFRPPPGLTMEAPPSPPMYPVMAPPGLAPPPGLQHPAQVAEVAAVPPPPKPEVPRKYELSVGGLLHECGECTPCKFFRGKRGCKDGSNCNLCHFAHEELTYSGIRRAMRMKGLQKRGGEPAEGA